MSEWVSLVFGLGFGFVLLVVGLCCGSIGVLPMFIIRCHLMASTRHEYYPATYRYQYLYLCPLSFRPLSHFLLY